MDELKPDSGAGKRGDYPQIPGLLLQPEVTRSIVADFFTAAAEFYRTTPWEHLNRNTILYIQVPQKIEPRYIIIMGQGGRVLEGVKIV